jgi:hypothetical protein
LVEVLPLLYINGFKANQIVVMRIEKTSNQRNWLDSIARVGLISKGIVYLTLGILAFMSAYGIGGQSGKNTDRQGAFSFIREAPGGIWLLVLLSIGLVCYSIWRGIQAFTKQKKIKWSKRLQYVFSALAYLSVAVTAIQVLSQNNNKNGDSNSYFAAQLMTLKYGQWIVGVLALFFAGIGLYQIGYGLSEKYKKHVQQLSRSSYSKVLLLSGKIGYVARGVVWLIIAYLLLKAAFNDNSAEAGGSGKAFLFIENIPYGSLLLAMTGIGFMAYGAFNFIRARYESFQAV